MQQNDKFHHFLEATKGQREVGLIIAQDEKELETLQQQLTIEDFSNVKDINQLLDQLPKGGKFFYMTSGILNKDMYDFLVQYPTGQIEIFNKEISKSKIIIPPYKDSTVVYLLTKNQLSALKLSGNLILDKVGIAYQS